MNNSRNQPWRGRNRNPNTNQSYAGQDSQTRYSSHSNLQETSYSSSSGQNVYSSTQNVSYNQTFRSFSGGQESDESRRFLSLNEQRSQSRQNSYRPRRNYNNRGNYRGGKGYYPKRRPRDTNGSDSESVSSNESQSQGKNRYSDSENQVNSFPQRIKGCGYSEDDSNSYQNSSADRNPIKYYGGLKRSPSIEGKPVNNFSNQRELVNAADANIDTEYNGSNKFSANSFGAINANETFSTYENDKLAALRNYKQNLEQLLKDLEPTELIVDCQKYINKLNTEAVSQNYKSISVMKKNLSENKNGKALQPHLANLLKQQKEFEATTANVKSQLSSILASDIHDLLKSTDNIKEEFQNECRLFKRSMPAYAYKGDILKLIKENQVTIISSDAPYSLNILLPVFAKKEFKEHYLVCCETSEMLCARLKRNVFHLLYNRDNMDEVDEKELVNSIRFMVVEDILNLFSNDYTVDEKNMFVILNLPLKRSLNLDIVLANLKDMLENHEEARVVLLFSHCDHPEKYEKYFSAPGEVPPIFFPLPNLTLPVKTIWKKMGLLPTDDYIEEVVKTALAIHALNDTGDILAFLPTKSDLKSVSVKLIKKLSDFRYADFDCVILHETTTSKYGLDLFSEKKSLNRTVFLATDCAEMVVIPTVCYVIDCGLKKENMFDVQKKLDVSTTTFISRDKCKLRKSLSGAFKEGVCYRLYNKENFCKEMPSCEYPEILTVNPFNSMIKVFQHRPQTATTVEFVESLPKATKENALKLLKKYNAVKDNTLTELGKNIVKLPYPAKYSKLILLGIQWGYTFEAVVLVAFFSVKGRVFEYSQIPEEQKLIDAVKLQLVQNDSDTLSYLYIYKTWIENNSELLWCTKHCINFETLVSVQAKVDEICRIVGESLKENILQEFSTAKDSSNDLLEMLFQCFQDNLCVFTGHYKSGYRVLSSRCIAFLHPSSIICQMENLPQFIIFDHMLPSSRDFLVTITAIPSDLVMQGLNDLTIDFDYSDMFEKSLVQKVIDPVGERMIKQVLLGKKGQKLKLIEEQIKKQLSTTSLVIEPMPDKGQVHVYALESQIDQAVKFVNDILKSQFEEIVNSEKTVILELKRGQVKVPLEVKWAKGANIVSIKTCDKTGVTIQNILDDEDENPSDVSPAVIQQSINLTWTRRRCNGQGFINVRSEDFNRARRLAMRQFAFMGSEFFVHLSKKEPNQLYLTGIPPEAKNWDLEEAFKHILPDIELERVELRYTQPFETSQNAIQEMKVKIEEMCREHTNLVDFSIVIPQPKNTATIMKAYINVPNEEDIEHASIQVSKCKMGEATITSKAVYRSIIKCKVEVCEALKESFLSTLNKLQEKLRSEFIDEEALFEFDINRISDASDIAAIKMLSNHREILETLQRAVNELLEGQVLNKMFNNKLGKIFCHGGHMWLQNLEKTCGVHIVEDYITKSLRLYGSDDNCYIAKNRIHQFLEDTENEVVKSFPLSVKGNRKLLKAVIVEYGANLEKFIESCELQSATLDIRSCLLTVHGNRDSLEKAEDALSELSVGLDSSGFSEVLNNEERCPVCDSSALNLTIRLELCGHLYCSECIQGLVDQAQFPLKCCASDCEKDIVLDDISKVLGDDAEKMRELLHKSMNNYIKDQQAEIFNCPAPDCTMFFYKKDLTGNKINCPLCQNDICRQCNAVFHQGLSCDMYQGSKIDADYSFKVWQKTNKHAKVCPRCKSGIEKNGGCNHMTCTSCNAHICWQCMTLFPTGGEVYDHMPYCHMYGKN